jgi:hypothetical protein
MCCKTHWLVYEKRKSKSEIMHTKTIPKLMIAMVLNCGAAHGQELNNPNKLPPCPKDQNARHHNCCGTYTWANGDKYVGELWKN